MTTQPLVVIGAGGFGREVISLVGALNKVKDTWSIVGVADDNPSTLILHSLARFNIVYLGTIRSAIERGALEVAVAVAIGDPATRERIVGSLPANTKYPRLVHPHATLGTGVQLDHGCIVAPGARVSIDVSLGQHVHVDQNVTIGHDTFMDSFVRANPAACISGQVKVNRGVLIGANATVLQGLTIGSRSIIGAASTVTRDVPPGAVMVGTPARARA